MKLKVTPIVDGHLDLAENVTLFGRDLTRSVATIRAEERRSMRQATVSLPELERGGIAVAIATVTAGFLAADVGRDFATSLGAVLDTGGSRGPGARADRAL